MPRRKNERPTWVYFIFDMRPEVLSGPWWRNGLPFYCGKTVFAPRARLADHVGRDSRRHPHRPLAKRIAECNGHIKIETMEFVPIGQNWAECERYWIRILRYLNPDCVNQADGGEGGAGVIPSEETRRKRSESLRNSERKKAATEARRGKPGHKHTEETKAKLRAAHLGMKASEETRAKMREAHKRRPPPTPERIAKVANAHRGMKRSAESRARMSLAAKNRTKRAVISASN